YFTAAWFGPKVHSCSASRIFTWIHACSAGNFILNAQLRDGVTMYPQPNELWMGSSTGGQKSFNDYFRQDFWQHTGQLGGLGTASLEAIFNSLSTEYPKSVVIDGKTEFMEPYILDWNQQSPFYLYN
ncbi:MAG: hypothetical protein KAU48_10525, partial [Candidatus Thorarchaeota archaeon]|nr:hypothetical protein [Candidatus Thorarchaeota archaeon]